MSGEVTGYMKEYIGTDVWPNPGSNLGCFQYYIYIVQLTYVQHSRLVDTHDWYLPTKYQRNE